MTAIETIQNETQNKNRNIEKLSRTLVICETILRGLKYIWMECQKEIRGRNEKSHWCNIAEKHTNLMQVINPQFQEAQ